MTQTASAGPTLNEIVLVAGASRTQARNATTSGVLHATELTWVDALLLRVHSVVASSRYPGEFDQRSRTAPEARARLASAVVREAAETADLSVATQLVVTRQDVQLLRSMGGVHAYLDGKLFGLEPAQVLPIGHWWSDMQWRMSPDVRTPEGTSAGKRRSS